MSIWIGIDEVGYGPKLGPMVLGLYSLHGSSFNDNFWNESSVESDPRKWKDQLVVCDSKELYKSQSGIKRLETSAQVLGQSANTFFTWLKLSDDLLLDEIKQYPWYSDDFTIPLEAHPDTIVSHQYKYHKALNRRDVRPGPVLIRPVLERRFNSMLKSHNKSRLEFEVIMKMLDHAMLLCPGEHFYVDVDKLGGRDYYSEILGTYYPMEDIQIVSESRQMAHYKLPNKNLDIRFSKGADRFSFTVAAASILAKYSRELFMKNLNRYWCEKIHGLQATAGYPEDAKRFMYVVKPQLLAAGYSENWMVREK